VHDVLFLAELTREEAAMSDEQFQAHLEYHEPTKPEATAVKRATRHPSTCVVCTKTFYSQRADAVYCSDKCRAKGSRRGLKHRETHSLNLTV